MKEVTLTRRSLAGVAAAIQRKSGHGQLKPGESYFTFGRQWNASSDSLHNTYLNGFLDGQAVTYWKLWEALPPQRLDELSKAAIIFDDRDVLKDVISDLYRDPANALISYSAIIYIARDKLDGKNIEESLRYSRQLDRGIITK